MNRYLKVLSLFWRASLAAELEYRVNFVLAAVTSVGNLVGSIFGLFLFYRNGYHFQGWSWAEALVVLGVFTVLQGFATTFLSPNLDRIVEHVRQGTLDFVLLKPISAQFWLSTRTLSPWGLPDLLLGFGVIIYAGQALGFGWQNYALGAFPLLLGLMILYSLWFMLGATSIWFVKIYNVTEVLRGLLEAGRFPMVAYPIAYRFFFTYIIPVAFLTSVPAEAFLGRVEPWWLVGAVALAVGLFGVSVAFWNFALRFYTSASS